MFGGLYGEIRIPKEWFASFVKKGVNCQRKHRVHRENTNRTFHFSQALESVKHTTPYHSIVSISSESRECESSGSPSELFFCVKVYDHFFFSDPFLWRKSHCIRQKGSEKKEIFIC